MNILQDDLMWEKKASLLEMRVEKLVLVTDVLDQLGGPALLVYRQLS